MINSDVLIIGAGPSGAVAAKLLSERGYQVVIVEKSKFPRFSIGESLLPQCVQFLKDANMFDAINAHNFQHKDGAVFSDKDELSTFDFDTKSSAGCDFAFQVQRATFDEILLKQAIDQGATVYFEQGVESVDIHEDHAIVISSDAHGNKITHRTKFILDASGFARVLSRLLNLQKPSQFPSRQSYFAHIKADIKSEDFDRNKILISIHPSEKDIWYWLIPFNDGSYSIGAVATNDYLDAYKPSADAKNILESLVNDNPALDSILENVEFITELKSINGYTSSVNSLYGKNYLLLGNAGEFLDPVFSSGVTIAVKSALLAVDVVDKHLKNNDVNWQREYADELQRGIDTFKVYVEAWYSGEFQDVIFHSRKHAIVQSNICSILAGYAWDESNPYVKNPKRRFDVLAQLCRKNA